MIALACIGGFVAIAILSTSVYALRLRQHVGLSRAEFVAHFKASGTAPEVSAAVYDHFQRLGMWRGFCPSPSDSLGETYKTVDEDVTQNLEEILCVLGCEMPSSRVLRQWNTPVETLAEVVGWINWVRGGQQPNAE